MNYIYSLKDHHFTLSQLQNFYGLEDYNIKLIEKEFHCVINANSEELLFNVDSETENKIRKLFMLMVKTILQDNELDNKLMFTLLQKVVNDEEKIPEDIKFVTTYNGKVIKPKNYSQYLYYMLLKDNTIVFALGSAGTGKTYLAVAYAVSLLKQKKIAKIIITRPIVEAGENLGFLPGEIKEKVDPYLTPIYDALYDMIGMETTTKYLEKQIIEIAPLAYMRGRTLNDAFVILDEAQNTTSTQMKMFLTRLGYNSKMVITGDQSQVDLKDSSKSGILIASSILKDIEDIGQIEFSSKDVVRHPLVSKIINAYEQIEKK